MKIRNTLHSRAIPTWILCTVFLGGCTKEQQEELKLEAEVLMEYRELEFTLAPTDVIGETQLTISLDGQALSRTLTENGYSMDQLKEFVFTSADLRLPTDATLNYDPFQRVHLNLSVDGGTAVPLASKDPVPDGVQALTLDVVTTNVAEILRHEHIQVTAIRATDQAITDTMHHVLDLSGRVVVKL